MPKKSAKKEAVKLLIDFMIHQLATLSLRQDPKPNYDDQALQLLLFFCITNAPNSKIEGARHTITANSQFNKNRDACDEDTFNLLALMCWLMLREMDNDRVRIQKRKREEEEMIMVLTAAQIEELQNQRYLMKKLRREKRGLKEAIMEDWFNASDRHWEQCVSPNNYQL